MHLWYLNPPVSSLYGLPDEPTVIPWDDYELVAIFHVSVSEGYLRGLLGRGLWLLHLHALSLHLSCLYQLLSLRTRLIVPATRSSLRCTLTTSTMIEVDGQ